jgi:hypothetical protein
MTSKNWAKIERVAEILLTADLLTEAELDELISA